MPVITDQDVVNVAGTTGDWTTSDFDAPTLNDSAATTPIYIEGTACMWWPLKKGVTGGYTYEQTANQSLTGRVLCGWINYAFSDIAAIPINNLYLRVSSATTFTTNYAEWDAKAQILSPKNTPISGHTPVLVYPTNPDNTSGTPNYADLESFGWVATTGNDADGKQGGFDMLHIIGYIGAHSATYTNTFFSSLDTDANPATIPGTANRPLGILSRAGDFYRTNVNLQLGDGTSDTADIVVSETGKVIFFDNVQPEHNLGYVLVNPSSTNEMKFSLTNCVHFWNEQDGTTPQILTTPNNADQLMVAGCSFSRGGGYELPTHDTSRAVVDVAVVAGGTGYSVNDTLTGVSGTGTKATFNVDTVSSGVVTAVSIVTEGDYTVDPDAVDTTTVSPAGGSGCTLSYTMKWYRETVNSTFDACDEIDAGDGVFEGNTVSNANGRGLLVGTGTNRTKNNTYTGNPHALHFDTAGTYTIDGDQFAGNTFDVENSSTGLVTLNLINGANASTFENTNGGSTVINNNVLLKVTVQDTAGSPIQNARAIIADTSTDPDTLLMNELTTVLGVAEETFNYGSGPDVDVEVRVRNGDGGTNYKPVNSPQVITASGLDVTITLEFDPNNATP